MGHTPSRIQSPAVQEAWLVQRVKNDSQATHFLSIMSEDPGMRKEQVTSKEYRVEKALVVNSQPEMLNATVEMIREFGYDVVTANCADEALDLIKRDKQISLLFSDVAIADMNGVALARAVRVTAPQVQIILAAECAARIFEDDEASPKEFGLVPKPCSISDVAKHLSA